MTTHQPTDGARALNDARRRENEQAREQLQRERAATTDPRLIHDADCTATHFEGGTPKVGCRACDYAAERLVKARAPLVARSDDVIIDDGALLAVLPADAPLGTGRLPRFSASLAPGASMHAMRLLLDGEPLRGVARFALDCSAQGDRMPELTLELVPESIDFEANVKLLLAAGAKIVSDASGTERHLIERSDVRETDIAGRVATIGLHAVDLDDARGLARKYLQLPTHMRYTILADLSIITKDEMTEAMLDVRAGKRLDVDALRRAQEKGSLVSLRQAIERAHSEWRGRIDAVTTALDKLPRDVRDAAHDHTDEHAHADPDDDDVEPGETYISADDRRALNRAIFALHTVAPVRAVLTLDDLRDVISRLSRIAGNPMSDDVLAQALALPSADV